MTDAGNEERVVDWTEHLRIEDLPDDLKIIAERAGVAVLRTLCKELAGVQVYIPENPRAVVDAKKRYIMANRGTMTVNQLVIATGLARRTVYDVMQNGIEDKQSDQNSLFGKGDSDDIQGV